MYRLIVYVSFALITFILGITVARFGSLFDSSPQTPLIHASKRVPSEFKGSSRSPRLSIDKYPGEALGLLYDSTEEKPDGKVRVNFLVENTSDKRILSYTVIYTSIADSSKNIDSSNSNQISRAKVLQRGELDQFGFDTSRDASLSLRINQVEFADGTQWLAPETR
jgi:hypothetical protein